jgi:predicted RNA-binding protein YlxR (DUF448 family)
MVGLGKKLPGRGKWLHGQALAFDEAGQRPKRAGIIIDHENAG